MAHGAWHGVDSGGLVAKAVRAPSLRRSGSACNSARAGAIISLIRGRGRKIFARAYARINFFSLSTLLCVVSFPDPTLQGGEGSGVYRAFSWVC